MNDLNNKTMKDIEKIFEAIHDVYESQDGGHVYLDDDKKLLIKNQLRQLILVNKNESISDVMSTSNSDFKQGQKVLIDGCLEAEIRLKNEQTYRVKYAEDGDFGDVPVKALKAIK